MKKRLLVLMSLAIVIVSLFSAANIVAMAAPGDDVRVEIKWHVEEGKGYYNPVDEGKNVSIYYYLEFNGKDENGEQKTWRYAPRIFKGKIGDTIVTTEHTKEMLDMNGKKYTDCDIFGIYVPLFQDTPKYKGNHIYGVSQGVNPEHTELWAHFDQNMETTTIGKIAPGTTIADEDKNDLSIKFTVAKINVKTGEETYPMISNSNMEIHRIMNFKDGEMQVWNDANEGYCFRRAIDVNTFGMFNPYNGRGYKYILKAEFAGTRKAELEKRYNLDMAGDDLKGWTLTLSSKETNNNETNNNNPAKTYPKTGDSSNIAIYGMILLISVAGVAIITLKRSKKQN